MPSQPLLFYLRLLTPFHPCPLFPGHSNSDTNSHCIKWEVEKDNFGSGETKTEGWGGYGPWVRILGTRQLKEWACVSERMVLAQEQVAISEVGINSGQLVEKESIRGGSSRSCFQSESSGQKPNCSREAPFLGKGNTDSVWLQGLDPDPVVLFQFCVSMNAYIRDKNKTK